MSARDMLAELNRIAQAIKDEEAANPERTELIATLRDQFAWNLETEPALKKIAEALLAAGYRKLEPRWAETLTNDGTYEYTVSSDCDGSNVSHWRRAPKRACIEDASPWQQYDSESEAI